MYLLHVTFETNVKEIHVDVAECTLARMPRLLFLSLARPKNVHLDTATPIPILL
jgi:hypothetical protein